MPDYHHSYMHTKSGITNNIFEYESKLLGNFY